MSILKEKFEQIKRAVAQAFNFADPAEVLQQAEHGFMEAAMNEIHALRDRVESIEQRMWPVGLESPEPAAAVAATTYAPAATAAAPDQASTTTSAAADGAAQASAQTPVPAEAGTAALGESTTSAASNGGASPTGSNSQPASSGSAAATPDASAPAA